MRRARDGRRQSAAGGVRAQKKTLAGADLDELLAVARWAQPGHLDQAAELVVRELLEVLGLEPVAMPDNVNNNRNTS